MEKRITADEARKKSLIYVSKEDERTLDEIDIFIKSEVENGSRGIYWHSHLSYKAMENIKDRGFEIYDLSAQREGICYKIKW